MLSVPSAHITTAIEYYLEPWERLCYYIADGMLNPDKNSVKKSIRPLVLGRNELFAGSHQVAQRLAMIYSLLSPCNPNEINPYGWLKMFLDKINSWTINRIYQLLPYHWKRICTNSVA